MLSDQLTAKQGPLSRVWLASHWERKISKAQFLHTNLNTAIDCIANNQTQEPIALRISGQLLLGVVRIHSRKTRYLLEDCNGALSKIKTSFKQGNVNLTETTNTKANMDSITLPERLDDFDILLPDSNPWSREQVGRDPMLDSLMTQDITLLDTQDNFLSFGEVMEQGRLLDQAEHQHIGDFGTLPMDDIEMGRRDNEAALVDRSFSADLNEGAMEKLQINDDTMGQQEQGGFDFDFDFGDGDDDEPMNRDQTPLPDFHLSGPDDTMDSLMEAGIVRMEEPDHIVFGLQDESSLQQDQPVRRRRRLVVDKVTEIPYDDLKHNMIDTSSIVDKTIDDISPTLTKKTKKLDLKKPIVCTEGSEVQVMVTRWNNNRKLVTAAAAQTTHGNNDALMDGNSGFDQDQGFDFDFGDDNPIMDQQNIFNPDMSLMNEDDDTIDQSQPYDDLNASTQQSTFGIRTKETIETLQQKFNAPSQPKVIPFDELAPITTAKKAQAARLFFDVLLLASKNVIKVKQPTAYGPIQIRQ